MKRIIAFSIVLLFLFLLSACGRSEPMTIYQDECITVTRHNRALIVQDAQTGEEYTFTLRRVRRTANAIQAARMPVNTERLNITTAFDVVAVCEKDSGQFICFRIR